MEPNETKKLGGDFAALTTLEAGERYTLLIMSGFGIGTIAMQITVESVKVGPYAQYSESVQVIFKSKGKRKLMGIRFHGSQSFAVWSGWVDVSTNAFTVPVATETGFIARQIRYLSFDIRYMTDAIASAATSPIFSKID